MTSFKQGMTLVGLFLCLFLLFPFSSKAGIYFLPDAQNEERVDALSIPPTVAVDSVRCEDIGYTYSSGQCPTYHNQENCVLSDKYFKCDAEGWCRDNDYIITSCSSPKYLDSQCPNNLSLYKKCTCPSEYKYACTGTGYSSGNGTVCDTKYTSCNCSTNYVWSGNACVCDSSFKYSCSGTGYSSGSGASCGGKYKSCNCSTYYSWNGSACVHYHSYSCASGYATSCSNGYYSTSPKSCTCGGSSGTCYACCSTSYKYTCSGTGYSGGSGGACNGKYTACSCASGYAWSGSACVRNCAVGYLYYTDGSCSASNNGKSIVGIVVKDNALVMSKPISMAWGEKVDIIGLTNMEDMSDYAGVSNTAAIVSYLGSSATNYAAVYCYNYFPGGFSNSKGKWYLPADGEIFTYLTNNYNSLSYNLSALGWPYWSDQYFWSSTERSASQGYARKMAGGAWYIGPKTTVFAATCFLAI